MKSNSYSLMRKLVLVAVCLVFGVTAALAQRTISGTVTDAETGEPLIGANVLIKGTSTGTVTDLDGNFSILATDEDVLIFSYTGYSAEEVVVGTQDRIEISMGSGELLDEIVVIGYGTAKKRDLTGAIAQLNNEDFNQGVIVSADQLIQGKTAGVQVLNNSGQPGGSTTVRIRGNTSIRLSGGPLYVLDGVPLSGTSARPDLDIQGLGGSPTSNPLNFLNPTDIESISVLKDASATAIYGSRGANGVIEISTKRGRNQKPAISFSTSFGVASILKKYNVLDGNQYREALNQYPDITSGDYGDNVDAFDEILRTAPVQNHAISINGGSARGSYRLSVGYFDQKGIIQKNDLSRISANFRGDYDFLEDDRLKVDFWLVASHTDEHAPPISTNSGFRGSLIGNALQWNPTHKMYNDDGSPIIIPDFGDFMNPIALNQAYNDNATTFDVIGAIAPSVKILDNLTYKFLYSISQSQGERRASVKPWLNLEDVQGRGVAYLYNKSLTTHVLQHTLNWTFDLGTNSFNVLGGYEFQKTDEKNQDMAAFDFLDTDLDFTNFIQYGSADSRSISSAAPPISELQSFFGRVSANLINDRFLVTATFRADGSSKFGENNRYGYFPSFAAAWNIHNEEFASGGFFNNLKLRAGWGITGNQDFDSGAALDRYALLDNGGAEQTNVGNPDLKWETTNTLNFGLDFAFLNYRLYGSIDWFNKTTTDLLFQLAPSQPAPATLYWVNLDGEVVNQGLELTLNALAVDNPNFQWDMGLYLTFLSNELKDYNGPNFAYGTLFGQGITGATIHRLDAGQPLNAFYLRNWQGLNEEGFDTFLDNNGNIVTATQDASYLGDPNPDILLGFSTTLTFGAFSIGMNWNGAFGHQIYNNTRNTVTPIGNLGSRNIDDLVFGNGEDPANSVKSSTRYMENGDYVKLANATLAYQFGNVGNSLRDLKVYVTGNNLLLFTGYNGFDPEVNTINDANGLPSAGIDYMPYPSARSFILGVNFTL